MSNDQSCLLELDHYGAGAFRVMGPGLAPRFALRLVRPRPTGAAISHDARPAVGIAAELGPDSRPPSAVDIGEPADLSMSPE
jgi:hypothetical protein